MTVPSHRNTAVPQGPDYYQPRSTRGTVKGTSPHTERGPGKPRTKSGAEVRHGEPSVCVLGVRIGPEAVGPLLVTGGQWNLLETGMGSMCSKSTVQCRRTYRQIE